MDIGFDAKASADKAQVVLSKIAQELDAIETIGVITQLLMVICGGESQKVIDAFIAMCAASCRGDMKAAAQHTVEAMTAMMKDRLNKQGENHAYARCGQDDG